MEKFMCNKQKKIAVELTVEMSKASKYLIQT